jgi:hypothetical protein
MQRRAAQLGEKIRAENGVARAVEIIGNVVTGVATPMATGVVAG